MQNFVAPSVIGFLYDRVSFFKWVGSILTYQRYYLPLFFYIITLAIILFCIIKASVQWNNDKTYVTKLPERRLHKDLIQPLIINLHLWILMFLILMMLVFILKSTFNFVYRTNLPVFTLYSLLFRFTLISAMVFIYAFLSFIIPVIRKGHCYEKASNYYLQYLAKRWKHIVPIYLVQALWIYISILVFQILIDYLLTGVNLLTKNVTKQPLIIVFANDQNVWYQIKNTLIIPLTFLLSNVLYSPFVFILKKGFERFRITLRSS